MLHVYPTNDLKEHDTKTTMCPCGPRVEWNDPNTGEAYSEGLVLHRSWDGRELREKLLALPALPPQMYALPRLGRLTVLFERLQSKILKLFWLL